MAFRLWELFCRWFSLAPRPPPPSSSPQSRGCPVQPVDLRASNPRRSPRCPLTRRHMCTSGAVCLHLRVQIHPRSWRKSIFLSQPRPGLQARDSASDEHAEKTVSCSHGRNLPCVMTRHASTLCRELEDAAGRAHSVVVLMLGRRGGCYWRRAPFPAGKAVRLGETELHPVGRIPFIYQGSRGSRAAPLMTLRHMVLR